MPVILLRKGGETLIDDIDIPKLAGLSLRERKRGRCSYVEYKLHGRTMLLHRLVLGAGPGQRVDHINGDGLDNRRANLRICDHAENMQSRRVHKNNKSGFKGVYFDRRRGKYRATVRAFNRKHCLGMFDCAEDAHAAYMAKAEELHGDFFRSLDVVARPEPTTAKA